MYHLQLYDRRNLEQNASIVRRKEQGALLMISDYSMLYLCLVVASILCVINRIEYGLKSLIPESLTW